MDDVCQTDFFCSLRIVDPYELLGFLKLNQITPDGDLALAEQIGKLADVRLAVLVDVPDDAVASFLDQ